MGIQYGAVGWNRQKRVYDTVLGGLVFGYLILFLGLGLLLYPDATVETLLIRGLSTCAFIMLHVVLVIGPIARLNPRMLPLLYNRRHLGVATFVIGLAHAIFASIQFYVLGTLGPAIGLLTDSGGGSAGVPFALFGVGALFILALMAATSHDFWLNRLTPVVWKRLHMAVYAAYLLLIAHVSFGILQQETGIVWTLLVGAGILIVGGVHVAAALQGRSGDVPKPVDDNWARACDLSDLEDSRGLTATVAGERVAIFRYGNKVSAVSNVCRHQNGPLGEGRIVNGCIVCPWHGYEYDPASGKAPPPFTEKVATFNVRIQDGVVYVHTAPNAAGTHVEPATL